MSRFLQMWFLMTIYTTITIGVIRSWNSTTLTLPLDIGLALAFVMAVAYAGFHK